MLVRLSRLLMPLLILALGAGTLARAQVEDLPADATSGEDVAEQGTQDTPTLSIRELDNPLIVRGIIDADTHSFSGMVRVTATGADVKELRLLASDLLDEAGASSVSRTQVTIPTGVTLIDGRPRDVPVTVSDVTEPGAYSGVLEFTYDEPKGAEPVPVELRLELRERPRVQPRPQTLTVRLVRVGETTRWLARWLFQDRYLERQGRILLDNETRAPVRIERAEVLVRSEETGVVPESLQLESVGELPALAVGTATLEWNVADLPPGRYQGTLRFWPEGARSPVEVALDLAVRTGPVWPLIILILGILVGRLAQSMESASAKMQLALMPRYYELGRKIFALEEEGQRQAWTEALQEIKSRINAGRDAETTLAAELDAFQSRFEYLQVLDSLASKLVDRDTLLKKLQPRLQQARQALVEGDLERAKTMADEVEAALEEAAQDEPMGATQENLRRMGAGVRGALERVLSVEEQPARKPPNLAQRTLAFLAGIQAEVRYWGLRPLLFLIFLVALALIGFQTLYVNGGETLGAGGVYDYLGLFLWGLSAEVAQKTLQKLGGGAT